MSVLDSEFESMTMLMHDGTLSHSYAPSLKLYGAMASSWSPKLTQSTRTILEHVVVFCNYWLRRGAIVLI